MKVRFLAGGLRHFIVVALAALSACATASQPIDLDRAVAIANDVTWRKVAAEREPLRVLIATEKDVQSVRRCVHDEFPRTAEYAARTAYVKSVREKIAGRRLYVIRYPLPPLVPEDGDVSIVGFEPCVLIDRDTGEVLGVFGD